jgi:rhodanese-related sulfurtransferase
MKQITPAALKALLDSEPPVLLDVREQWEYETVHLPGSVHIPMTQIPQRQAELDRNRPIVVICHHGMRSQQVADFLERKGVTDVGSLSGGLDAWSLQVDPAMPRY